MNTINDMGRSHIDPYLVRRGFADSTLEPLGTDHRRQQVCKNESGYHGSQVNHFNLNELGDRDQGQSVLVGEGAQLGQPGHGAVVVDDLGHDPGRGQAGQPARSTAASVWPGRRSTPPWV